VEHRSLRPPGEPRTLSGMTTTTGSGTSLPRAVSARAVAGLRSAVRGAVFGPGDNGYEEHRRVWNGSIDRHPALITRCIGANDVRIALRFGRDHELSDHLL
jgi:hypothetical protein